MCSILMARSLNRAWPAKSLRPTLMDSHQAIHPWCPHSPTRSLYFGFFLFQASSIQSCQGIVSPSRITCLVVFDIKTMSGLYVVTVMVSGKLQVARSLPGLDICGCSFIPALAKAMGCLSVFCCSLRTIPEQIASAITIINWSGCQQYRPSPRAFRQGLSICSSVPPLCHSERIGN